MKKINLLLVFILAFTNMYSQDLNGKIEYSIESFKQNKKARDVSKKINSNIKNLVSEVIAKSKDLKLLLYFNNNKSFFTSPDPLNINKKEERLLLLAKTTTGIQGNYYYIPKKNLLVTDREFMGERFIIEEVINKSRWNLINETEKIGDFSCYKAERIIEYITRKGKKKRKQVVWYTTEIPLPYGPIDFVGLSGLVVKVIDRNLVFSIKKIELNPKEKIDIEIPKKGNRVTKEEFDKIVEESSLEIILKKN